MRKTDNCLDFCVFILTHGRPTKQHTLNYLNSNGYTGKVFLICDNEDSTLAEYKKLYGEQVIVFDKKAEAEKTDSYDLSENRKVILYARNVCFEIAGTLGYDYFFEFDDDYSGFAFKYQVGNRLEQKACRNLDEVFQAFVNYYAGTNAISVAFAQGGDFIGGINSAVWKSVIRRKAMNTFLCSTKRPFRFLGRINEDVNTYTLLGSRGELFLTVRDFMINQAITQSSSGGMTEVYQESGTYLKTFYSVVGMPSAVKCATLGQTDMRIHHKINFGNCVPKIINEKYRKE